MLTLEMHGRKWDIFLSSVNLFAEHGFENVTVRDIAAANGMRAASLYNHFPSKESILDQIYQFYRVNIMNVAPDLDEILALVPERSPNEILHQTMSYFDEELQPIMDKITLIAMMRAHRDSTAHELIWNYHAEHAKRYLRSVLQKMIDCDKIEPLDIDSFLELFISFAYTSLFRNSSPAALGLERWLRGLDTLFSLAKEKPQPFNHKKGPDTKPIA